MRLLMCVFLAAAAICVGGDVPEMQTTVMDRDVQGGKSHWHSETISRGEIPVVRTLTITKDGSKRTSRSYMVSGDLVMTETDCDTNGIFRTLALYNPAKNEMDVFVRNRDGSVRPVDAEELRLYKKENSSISEFWGKVTNR